jgi:hypothetical protein
MFSAFQSNGLVRADKPIDLIGASLRRRVVLDEAAIRLVPPPYFFEIATARALCWMASSYHRIHALAQLGAKLGPGLPRDGERAAINK